MVRVVFCPNTEVRARKNAIISGSFFIFDCFGTRRIDASMEAAKKILH